MEEDGAEVFCSAAGDAGRDDSGSGAPAAVGEGGATDASGVRGCVRAVGRDEPEAAFAVGILVTGDVRLVFYHRNAAGVSRLAFFLCLHTGFVEGPAPVFARHEVDMAADDTRGNVFRPNFAVRVEFEHVPLPREPVPEAARRRGAALGPFRRVGRPGAAVTEAAALMRCRDREVQARFAEALGSRVHRRINSSIIARLQSRGVAVLSAAAGLTVLARRGSGQSRRGSRESSGPRGSAGARESLCCASGPPVLHEEVQMYRLNFGSDAAPLRKSREYLGGAGQGGRGLQRRQSLLTIRPLARSVQGLARALVSGNKYRFTEVGLSPNCTLYSLNLQRRNTQTCQSKLVIN